MGNKRIRNKRGNRKRFQKNGMSKIKNDIKWLKKNVEFKFIDTTLTDVDCSSAGTVTYISGMLENALVNGRVGREVTARRIAIRGKIENTNGTPVDTLVRIILFRKRHVHGTTVPLTELLSFGGSAIPLAWRQMNHKFEYKVMFDTTFTMDTLTHSLIPFKLVYKLNHTQRFDAAGAGVGECEENGLFLVALSEVASGANNPTMDFSARYSYADS